MTTPTLEDQKPPALSKAAQPVSAPASARLTSLDACRGYQIVLGYVARFRRGFRPTRERWAALVAQLVLAALPAMAADAGTNQFLPAIPNGYYLQEYDDCGVEGRQPHVVMKDCYLWTFATSDTDAGLKERSAVFSYKGIQAVYDAP